MIPLHLVNENLWHSYNDLIIVLIIDSTDLISKKAIYNVLIYQPIY